MSQENLATVFKDQIEKVIDNYDVIIFDCPPAISSATAAATLASTRIVMPVTPMKFSFQGLKASIEEISSLEKKFKTFYLFYAVTEDLIMTQYFMCHSIVK